VSAIVRLKFVYQVFDMEVHGRLRDAKHIGNLFVAVTIADEAKHFQLSGRQLLFAHVFGKLHRDGRRKCLAMPVDPPDGRKYFIAS
jgi:hypothetical protein